MSTEKNCSCHGACAAAPAVPPSVAPGAADLAGAQRSVFRIPGMDCPAEEQMIRLRLADLPVIALEFDLPGRQLVVCHGGSAADVLACLLPLGYGAELAATAPLAADAGLPPETAGESRTLWLLLAINGAMFVVEMIAGWMAQSTGLLADGADMFADAAVYGLALHAVGRTARHKLAAARLAGLLQLLLALGALAEVARRALAGGLPDEMTMVGISLLALSANIACLVLISRHRQGGVHMRASYIFSANDVLANLGVILAGGLVAWTGSPLPDWLIGGLIGLLVAAGAARILRLR